MDEENIKKAILGSEDYQEIMRDALFSGMQKRAGFIPPKSEDEGFDFTFEAYTYVLQYHLWKGQETPEYKILLTPEFSMCFGCAWSLNIFFNNNKKPSFTQNRTIEFRADATKEGCQMCGLLEDLPF